MNYADFNWGYVPNTSYIHQLDPRIKLLALFGLMLALFFSGLGVLLVFGLCIASIKLAQLSYKRLFRSLYALKWLFLFAILFHLFFTPGHYIVNSWGMTNEGLYNGVLISTRLMLLVIISAMLMLTTSPLKLTQGLESLLSPLERFGLPVSEVALMIMLSLQFIPVLLGEARRLVGAQYARGIDFSQANIIQRARNALALCIPLIVGAHRKAENVAISMQTRGYCGRRPHSRLHPLKLMLADYIAGIIVIGILFIAGL
jgi:energy-coupling factor transport system permease protein